MQDVMTVQQIIQIDCPTCGEHSEFHHIGQQQWPEAVAKKLNIPTTINLYGCEHCQTTLTDIQLNVQEKI